MLSDSSGVAIVTELRSKCRVCVCVCVCVHVYVVYEDTNLYNDMGITFSVSP